MADSEVQDFVKGFLNDPLTKFEGRATGNLKTNNKDEIPQGNPLDGHLSTLFRSKKPIKESFREFLNEPGVKSALKGNHPKKDYEKKVRQVIKWVETGCNKPINVNMLLDAPDYDFLFVYGFPIVVSERALTYLEKYRKDQFEAFQIIDVNRVVRQKYYAINVITPDFDFNFDRKFKGLRDA
jgi:hypothetical protein